jgi:hypothetical protein
MTLLDDLDAIPDLPAKTCLAGRWLDTLTAEDRTAVIDAFLSDKQASAIIAVLYRNGMPADVGVPSLLRHRRGLRGQVNGCGCQ